MKKQGVCLLCAVVVLNLLSGCGGEYAGLSDRGAASGSAVSGQAVENERKEENSYRFRTDTNLYWVDNSDVTIQMRLDGSHKRKLNLRGFEYYYLIYVEADFLYYVAEKSGGQDVICRVPVGKDEKGFDLVDTEHVEELVTASSVSVEGVDSHYIYYTEKNQGQLVQFDRQSKKKIRIESLKQDCDVTYFICDSYVFVQTTEEEAFFVKEQNETKWHRICDPDYDPTFITYCMDENAVYYEEDNGGNPAGVGIVDITKMKSEPPQSDYSGVCREFIGEGQLKQEAAKAKGLETGKIKGCGIANMHCEGDRLYLQVEMGYEMDGWYRIEYLMFSKGREETELCYEKDLTDFMRDNASVRTGALVNWTRDEKGNRKWHVVKDKVKAEQVWCYRIVNGKAFLSFWNQKKGRGRVACYELATGIFRWLEDTDKEFYEPCYDDACDEDTYIDDCYNAEAAFFDAFALYQEGGFHDK